MTKVGLLVECGRDGLEVIVCRKICQLITIHHRVEVEVEIVPMDNKARLLEECGSVTRNLLRTGCDRVVILWDERPSWPTMGEALCWLNDRKKALGELANAHVPNDRVHLVCIEREFESWLLFDHKLIEAVLSTPEHPVTVAKQKNPDKHANPKGVMTTLFRKHGKTYVDVQFARRFADGLATLVRLRKCKTFKRFEERIVGKG